MNLKEWRDNLVEWTTPSGLTIKYDPKFGLFDLAATGDIPQVMLAAIGAGAEAAEGQRPAVNVSELFTNMPELIRSANAVVQASWRQVEYEAGDWRPLVLVDDEAIGDDKAVGDDKAIATTTFGQTIYLPLGEIPAGDKVGFFTQTVQGAGVNSLDRFPAQPAANGAAAPGGAKLRPKAKPVGRRRS